MEPETCKKHSITAISFQILRKTKAQFSIAGGWAEYVPSCRSSAVGRSSEQKGA